MSLWAFKWLLTTINSKINLNVIHVLTLWFIVFRSVDIFQYQCLYKLIEFKTHRFTSVTTCMLRFEEKNVRSKCLTLCINFTYYLVKFVTLFSHIVITCKYILFWCSNREKQNKLSLLFFIRGVACCYNNVNTLLSMRYKPALESRPLFDSVLLFSLFSHLVIGLGNSSDLVGVIWRKKCYHYKYLKCFIVLCEVIIFNYIAVNIRVKLSNRDNEYLRMY